ncbi:Sm-like ribonucleo protein [Tilletiopsis washingtonensis]|uniref:LSM complex subunit LSM4 n=1 Tax=Tilletiopsis washingtonensis TaxID=58919 RepID=A0A316Z7L2_9BASI|nr:Sm-like ribonucleo protein [Tilletiopsis washingtonensis]PWN97561.1 Sm-like ribonucleo protein [Tilletiopsis washingtonensis]
MLPLTLLNAAKGRAMLVELKSGETFNGTLDLCDNFMNLTLRDVYQTSSSGEQFWKLKECYIRGSNIKYCRVVDSLVDTVREQEEAARKARQAQGAQGGGGGGAGGPGARGGARGGRVGGERGGRGGGRGGERGRGRGRGRGE